MSSQATAKVIPVEQIKKLDSAAFAGGSTCDVWRCRLRDSKGEQERDDTVAVKVVRLHAFDLKSTADRMALEKVSFANVLMNVFI